MAASDEASAGGASTAAGGGDMTHPETFASTIGQIAWLATMSADHKERPIGWLERTVFPGLLLRQFKLYLKDKQPVAAIVYALLDDDHFARWQASGDVPTLEHWRSGANVAVVACVSPFAEASKVTAEFMTNLPPNARQAASAPDALGS